MEDKRRSVIMELDLRSLLGPHVQSCNHWLRSETAQHGQHPPLPPPPAFGLIYEGAIGQQKVYK